MINFEEVKVSSHSYGAYDYSVAEYDAIQKLENAGHLFVTASGNDGLNLNNIGSYPCMHRLSNIVCVGSVGGQGTIITPFTQSVWSNYNQEHVDIYAPGENVLSTDSGGSYIFQSGIIIYIYDNFT